MSDGDTIIDAIIRSSALDSAIVGGSGTVFVWSANAAEQIEVAMWESGYKLTKITQDGTE